MIQEENKKITCEYCKPGKYQNNKLLLEATKFGVSDCYIGIDMWICEKILFIEATGEVGYPSKDSTLTSGQLKINYCPMCGRRL